MTDIKLQIDGRELGFERLWVHMQDPHRASPVPYRISVPLAAAQEIFDPHYTKAVDKDWTTFIKDQVRDLGGFILDGYLDGMKAILGNNSKSSWEWVLATVDDVHQSEDAIEIVGQAVPFDPGSY
jgi:hypothetical protein